MKEFVENLARKYVRPDCFNAKRCSLQTDIVEQGWIVPGVIKFAKVRCEICAWYGKLGTPTPPSDWEDEEEIDEETKTFVEDVSKTKRD